MKVRALKPKGRFSGDEEPDGEPDAVQFRVMLKFLLSLAILVLLAGTACASEGADIQFHVSIAGDGKLHPGDDTIITVLIENEGRVTDFLLNENMSQLLQLITTAKDLRVEIGDAGPIKVETVNPQLVGDLPSGRVAKAVFRVKVDEDAKLGEYRIPVKLRYTRVTYTSTSGVTVTYNEGEYDVENLKVEIVRKDYDFSVVSLNSSLKAGEEGKVDVVIKNTGNNKICDAVLIINTTPPLIPNAKAMSAYLGSIDVDKEAEASFKVYVMDEALNQTYPAELILKFKTPAGVRAVLSQPVGLKVVSNESFVVTGVDCLVTSPKTIPKMSAHTSPIQQQTLQIPQIPQQVQQNIQPITVPSRGFILVNIKNAGEDVSDCVAVLSFDSPLFRVENSPCIGHFGKGENRSVLFYVKSTAPPGRYQAFLMLKYRNELGDEEVSKKKHIEVEVKSSPPLKVERVETENLGVGLKGYVRIFVKNCLNEGVSDAEFSIVSPDSSITPLSSMSFLKELKPNESGEVGFRLSVSDEAMAGSYRLYLIERYSLGNAEDLVSVAEVPVVIKPKKAYFEVLSVESNLYPDETGRVAVEVKNAGSLTIHNAVVELEVSTPLTIAGGSSLSGLIGRPQPGLYFVGTLKPGEVAVAKFRVDVDKDAGAGYYPATVRIKYDDEEGYSHESNPVTVSLEVKEKPLLNPVTATAAILIAVAIVAGAKFAKGKRAK